MGLATMRSSLAAWRSCALLTAIATSPESLGNLAGHPSTAAADRAEPRTTASTGIYADSAKSRTRVESALLKAMLDAHPLPKPPAVLTIAGSDPSGGAGIQADLKTFHQFGVYGMAVPTLLTVQNTCAFETVEYVSASLVAQQIDCVIADIRPAAVKTGALGSVAVFRAVADWAQQHTGILVVDPVIKVTHGESLASRVAVEVLVKHLVPAAFLVTPNLHEASIMAGFTVHDLDTMGEAARKIATLGANHVLVTGGHLREDAIDVLWSEGEIREYRGAKIDSSNTHGTGCAYSAAITAMLARGTPLPVAVDRAKRFVTEAIRTAPGLGSGYGPLNHHAPVEDDPAR